MYINLHPPLSLFNVAYLFLLSFPLKILVSFVFIALVPIWQLVCFFPVCDLVSFVLNW